MKIAFVWQGWRDRIYGHWEDGLREAMRIIEKEHEVRYFDPSDDITDVDIILYWEAPCTAAGKYRDNYEKVRRNPIKKALLFAGGPIKREWCTGFDLFFVESAINEKEFSELGLPWKRAFGVNTKIFKPEKQPKVWDGMFQATCASWKRHWLIAEALGDKAMVCGRGQPEDPTPFMRAREHGALVLPEVTHEAVNTLLNASHTVVNCCDYWGGGQRTTLEAMAAGIPVIVMTDSIKNREYVEESQAGLVIDPDPNKIREAVRDIKDRWTDAEKARGVAYVLSKWTSEHYAQNLLEGIKQII